MSFDHPVTCKGLRRTSQYTNSLPLIDGANNYKKTRVGVFSLQPLFRSFMHVYAGFFFLSYTYRNVTFLYFQVINIFLMTTFTCSFFLSILAVVAVSEFFSLLATRFFWSIGGVGIAEWWLHSLPTYVAWVRVTNRLSCLLVLYSAPRGFSLGSPVFASPQKSTFPNSNSIRCRTSLKPPSGEWSFLGKYR